MLIISSLLLMLATANIDSIRPAPVEITEQITEQVNKTVTLAPGSNVRVSGINGRVTIVTWDSDKAEINITIKAPDREAMERRRLIIEDTANSLTIRTEERRGGGGGSVSHEVNLKLPREINLKINGVNGAVDVGQINGEVGIDGVNGRVIVAQAGTATVIKGINGSTTITLVRLGEGGLLVNGCNGGVSIGLPISTNANIYVHGINGGIDTDLPITVTGEIKRGQMTGTIGSGGAKIEISGINGGVQLRRN
jgi:hypothetical protein